MSVKTVENPRITVQFKKFTDIKCYCHKLGSVIGIANGHIIIQINEPAVETG
jgi:hypothetical protein